MSGQRRLDKVAATLRPKEAVLVWMAEAHSHRSLQGYMDTLRDATDEAFPLVRLGRQMEAAVRAAHRGEPEADVWPLIRYAVRDAGFLYFLSANMNQRVMEHQRANWLHIALVAELLRGVEEPSAERQRRLGREQAQDAAETILVQQGVAEAVAKRYFGGATPLYPDVAETVARQVEQIEQIVALFNDLVWQPEPTRGKRKRIQAADPSSEQLDSERIRHEAQPAIHAQFDLVVDLSKSEAWRFIGERDQRLGLMRRHVWPEGERQAQFTSHERGSHSS